MVFYWLLLIIVFDTIHQNYDQTFSNVYQHELDRITTHKIADNTITIVLIYDGTGVDRVWHGYVTERGYLQELQWRIQLSLHYSM